MLLSLQQEAASSLRSAPATGASAGPTPTPTPAAPTPAAPTPAAPTPAAPTIHVVIQVHGKEKILRCNVRLSLKISGLKHQICVYCGLAPDDTCLFFAGEEANREKTVAELGMKQNSVLVVFSRGFLNPPLAALSKKCAPAPANGAPLTPQPAPVSAKSVSGAPGVAPKARSTDKMSTDKVSKKLMSFFEVFDLMATLEARGFMQPTKHLQKFMFDALGEHQPDPSIKKHMFFDRFLDFVENEWRSFPLTQEPDVDKWKMVNILDGVRRLKTHSAASGAAEPPGKRRKL